MLSTGQDLFWVRTKTPHTFLINLQKINICAFISHATRVLKRFPHDETARGYVYAICFQLVAASTLSIFVSTALPKKQRSTALFTEAMPQGTQWRPSRQSHFSGATSTKEDTRNEMIVVFTLVQNQRVDGANHESVFQHNFVDCSELSHCLQARRQQKKVV